MVFYQRDISAVCCYLISIEEICPFVCFCTPNVVLDRKNYECSPIIAHSYPNMEVCLHLSLPANARAREAFLCIVRLAINGSLIFLIWTRLNNPGMSVSVLCSPRNCMVFTRGSLSEFNLYCFKILCSQFITYLQSKPLWLICYA